MKVAVFGASGFMGYNFMQHAMNAVTNLELTTYSTSPVGLTNLSRHDVKIELTSYADLSKLELDHDTDFIINFAHPFSIREGLTTKQQSKRLAHFLQNQLESNSGIRLIHFSTMSVYEPFADNCEFQESYNINPPKHDNYASDKAAIDKQILSNESIKDRILLLRPTVVYGPFGKPWTDNIFVQLLEGDVPHFGLKGRIQPIWVSDASRFILERMDDFVPGILNLAGPDTLPWGDFLRHFEVIASAGTLKMIPSTIETDEKRQRSFSNKAKSRCVNFLRHPSFKKLVLPLWQQVPELKQEYIKRHLRDSSNTSSGFYCKSFFEEDRLVSMKKFEMQHKDFSFTPLEATVPTLEAYFRFRFNDGPFW